MICNKCGSKIEDGNLFCSECGTKVEIASTSVEETNMKENSIVEEIRSDDDSTLEEVKNEELVNPQKKNFKVNKKTFFAGIGIFAVLILLIFIFKINSKPNKNRAKVLLNLEKDSHLKFTIDDQEFYIGDKVSTYKEKNYSYDNIMFEDEDLIASDSISLQTFYNNNKAAFLGALYCSSSEDCKYDDAILVKINFYSNSKVLVDDYIKIGMKYDDVVEKYGKEDGVFYQDENYLVWAFGAKGKIGQPYYLLRFDTNSLFANNTIDDIRIGVWWYDGEYEHTVLKNTSKEEK